VVGQLYILDFMYRLLKVFKKSLKITFPRKDLPTSLVIEGDTYFAGSGKPRCGKLNKIAQQSRCLPLLRRTREYPSLEML
jgi:hypothetical protein